MVLALFCTTRQKYILNPMYYQKNAMKIAVPAFTRTYYSFSTEIWYILTNMGVSQRFSTIFESTYYTLVCTRVFYVLLSSMTALSCALFYSIHYTKPRIDWFVQCIHQYLPYKIQNLLCVPMRAGGKLDNLCTNSSIYY